MKDQIRRPITVGARVHVNADGQNGTVIGRTEGRRTMVDVRLDSGRVLSFYGTSLFLI